MSPETHSERAVVTSRFAAALTVCWAGDGSLDVGLVVLDTLPAPPEARRPGAAGEPPSLGLEPGDEPPGEEPPGEDSPGEDPPEDDPPGEDPKEPPGEDPPGGLAGEEPPEPPEPEPPPLPPVGAAGAGAIGVVIGTGPGVWQAEQ
ncbi:MAG: hypothetical protein Q9160_006940 [Pyrenula sp. 1 TL-2023]